MLDAAPQPRTSFHAASLAIEAAKDGAKKSADLREGLLDKDMVNKQRMDTIVFSIGGAPFHAVALSCEQNSPVMRAKLGKISNIYKQVIPMRNVGNLDATTMYEVRPPSRTPCLVHSACSLRWSKRCPRNIISCA